VAVSCAIQPRRIFDAWLNRLVFVGAAHHLAQLFEHEGCDDGVFAAFEHGDHYYLDGDWLAGRRGLGRKEDRKNSDHD